ncbi:hypothetical protein [Streptomyces rapamycinicus]|uniref:Secreted protein n=2 Tax=Streptomyces rapamycinicus TaxID=1226757 RepID=A0A0A0NTY9_STRRN|nr:hypothetical protein [Streptomyces rapamycinicus]AGP60794.1 hypothetical protein M271_47155 [Streptomyces rapamycinicus NRRL 5491]MBB4788038.1 DNA-binding protein H-NS [Streptomyces rapamycinicus]RLV72375.1 hypothetical protein D3C57_147650 [Streptomyces rapamycinicus NRRL 5491]UTP36335.1 hypothetical protein LIV37_47885 [Streptomyces rapamycinicus NRRL 5491]
MTRKRTLSGKKKLGLLIGSLALAGTGAGVLAATSNASTEGAAQSSTACAGLEQALANNEKFIADQQANPDAQSQARIANRQAVIEEIKRKQQASGCAADDAAGQDEAAAPAEGGASASASASAGASDSGAGGAGDAGAAGEVVCAGSTVTLSGEDGAPAASSNEFPVGTKLKVTNLDNDKSTTVSVTSTSGSCALLNNAAFEQVREPGKFLIRNARIERVG